MKPADVPFWDRSINLIEYKFMKSIFSKVTNSFLVQTGLVVSAIVLMVAPVIVSAATFNTYLHSGSRGAEVSALQTYLAQDTTLYPQGLVTGYFGAMTKSAVIRFQAKNGLTADGLVGAATRAALNNSGAVTYGDAPQIYNTTVSASRNSANVMWSTNMNSSGMVYFGTIPLTLGEHENSVDISGYTAMTDNAQRTSQNVLLQNLLPNTTYYYTAYVTGNNGIVSMTWPSTFTTTN